MNSVLEKLCTDHANFTKLLNVVEGQADAVAAGLNPDMDVLAEIIEYFAGYPARYHHPLEDAVYRQLSLAVPLSAPAVNAMLQEHAAVRVRLNRFKEVVESVKQDSIVSRSTFSAAARDFVAAERAHMEYERAEIFPAALAGLTSLDWAAVAETMPRVDDGLFETHHEPKLKRLHELLTECESNIETVRLLQS